MSLSLGQRIKLLQETAEIIEDHLDRLRAEVQSVIREISLDIPKTQE